MSVSTSSNTNPVPPTRNAKPKILGFVCEWSLGRTDLIHQDGSVRGLEHIKTIRIPCSGFVKPEWVQVGFENGAQGVFILGCPLGDCHFNEGNVIISERLTQLRKRLTGRKTIDDDNRIAELYLGATESSDFVGMMQDFSDFIAALPELAPPVKKGRAARADAAKPATPAAKPAAEAAPAAPAVAAAADASSPEVLAAQRVGPSPAKSADPDAALQAHQDTAPAKVPVDPALANVDPSPVTNEPLAATSAPTAAPAGTPASTPSQTASPTTPVASQPAASQETVVTPAPAAEGEKPRKQYKRWEPKKDGDG